MNGTAIQTLNLTRQFGSLKAVDGMTFEVPAGTVFGFLGPNGSGKTTTIRLLLGLLKPTAGSARVLGFDVASQPDRVREQCGALLEHTGLYERLTALDNLHFYGRVWHLSAEERDRRIQKLLTDLDLWDRRHEVVGTWSRGMKQKLAVARALLHQPRLVFLDEPTAGLDPVASAALREDLENLVHEQGLTVFLTTHNLAEAEKLCDLVAVIRAGQVLMVGSPDELRLRAGSPQLEVVGRGFSEMLLASLRARPEVRSLELRDHHLTIALSDGVDTAPLVQEIIAAGVQVDEVRKGKASLEEVFLTMMEEQQ
ncbi:MAG TPA: ABC transporter ATP-binding protein [Chloroflexi bacterium]|nr:ABC transporter ATP-binding protein [Chloroflexota bacterium]HPO57686.1 ABC transporter ATP-binding protein [Anaerolineaceae bacterium]